MPFNISLSFSCSVFWCKFALERSKNKQLVVSARFCSTCFYSSVLFRSRCFTFFMNENQLTRTRVLLYVDFIYYKKAFDSIETSAVNQALRNEGVYDHSVRILEYIYNRSTATIVLHKEKSKIPIRKASDKETRYIKYYSQHVYQRYSEHSIRNRSA